MDKGQRVIVRIEKVIYKGLGLAHYKGLSVFIAGAIDGETVEAEIFESKKKYARARLIKLLEASSKRIEPVCPFAIRPFNNEKTEITCCPGCAYQHMKYEDEVSHKNNQFIEMFRYKIRVDDDVFLPPILSPVDNGYRNKITIHFDIRNDKVVLGYFGEDNRTIIDISDCPLALNPLNKLLVELRNIPGFVNSLNRKDELLLRFTYFDGAQYCINRTIAARKILTERTSIGNLTVPIDGFFQVNPFVIDILLSRIIEIIEVIRPSLLIDLYCGTGIFSLAAMKAGVINVIGIDSDGKSIAAAKKNAALLGFNNIKHIAIEAAEGLKKVETNSEKKNLCVIIDPPRTGLENNVIDALIWMKPRNIIYVSCAADTLVRDLEKFIKAGYHIQKTGLLDMFPRTPYFESVTHLLSKEGQ